MLGLCDRSSDMLACTVVVGFNVGHWKPRSHNGPGAGEVHDLVSLNVEFVKHSSAGASRRRCLRDNSEVFYTEKSRETPHSTFELYRGPVQALHQ